MNYPVLLGKEAVGDAYGGVPALPESFFIGRDGKIVDKIMGLEGRSEIEDSIKKALNTPGRPIQQPRLRRCRLRSDNRNAAAFLLVLDSWHHGT